MFKKGFKSCLKVSPFNLKISKKYSKNHENKNYDLVVVGGGIVGTASAREILLRHPNLKIAVVEKESRLGVHQTGIIFRTGHNSGVIHAGIYYKPGSLMAKLCVEGAKLAYKFLDENSIPYKQVGKLIVATDQSEISRLEELYDRGLKNGVPNLAMIDKKDIKQIEPYCQGLKAIHSPFTGIVDWGLVCEYFGKDLQKNGGHIFHNFQVVSFKLGPEPDYPVLIGSSNGEYLNSRNVLTCAGLQSDVVAKLSGCSRNPRIVPVRGEYLLLNEEKSNLVKGNIYPVPDPKFPFLGVHFTPRLNGEIWLGPNAVLAFKREGYTLTDFNLSEFIDAISYRGFQKLAIKNFKYGTMEMIKSRLPFLIVKDLQKYFPQITKNDIKFGPAGVRAQALDEKGNLINDFVFDKGKSELGQRILHCRNAPSPGATSSMAIAKMICDKIENEFNLPSYTISKIDK